MTTLPRVEKSFGYNIQELVGVVRTLRLEVVAHLIVPLLDLLRGEKPVDPGDYDRCHGQRGGARALVPIYPVLVLSYAAGAQPPARMCVC